MARLAAIDRYERRALSRRKRAIRELDDARSVERAGGDGEDLAERSQLLQTEQSACVVAAPQAAASSEGEPRGRIRTAHLPIWPNEANTNWPNEANTNWPNEATANWQNEATANWQNEATGDRQNEAKAKPFALKPVPGILAERTQWIRRWQNERGTTIMP